MERENTIKTIIKFPDNMVSVFDTTGKEIPEYSHLYEKVKGCLIEQAPPDAVFYHASRSMPILREVRREDW